MQVLQMKKLMFVQATLWVVEGLVDGHPLKKLNQHKIDFTKVHNMLTQEAKNMDDYVSLHKRFYQKEGMVSSKNYFTCNFKGLRVIYIGTLL